MRMKGVVVVVKCSFVLGILRPVFSSEWSYEGENGPSHWRNLPGNEACGGMKQSPINIEVSDAVYSENLTQFTFHGFDSKPTSMTLKNNGHTAQVNLEGNIKVSGGGLNGNYKTAQFHFHWGSTDSKGSEHTIDNKQYPMEVHFVHYSSQYSNLLKAADNVGGLAALSFMVEITEKNNTALHGLVSGLSSISHKGSSTLLVPFSLDSILPRNRESYYRYDGSVTTPKCQETLTWTIFTNTIKMSQAQLGEFRKLHSHEEGDTHHEGKISNNFRPVQELNERIVYTSAENSSSQKHASSAPVILMIISLISLRT